MLDLGPVRAVGHQSAAARVPVPPDELVISVVAVDDEPPRVIIESIVDDATVPVIVLDVGQAAGLAAGLLASAGTATFGGAQRW